MRPTNLLLIMSDEHNRSVLGAADHPVVHTPNLDKLAENGTRFTDAYCNSPICVPSRASFATGQFVHEVRRWDNATPYDGSIPSWHHRLRAEGHLVTSIGKLHFRSSDDDNGFTEELIPLHVPYNIGDPLSLIRDNPPARPETLKLGREAGRGDSTYQKYDDRITAQAESWLRARASEPSEKPWVLFVSLVCPHFPLIARPQWYDLYPEADVPLPPLYTAQERPRHPFIDAMRKIYTYDEGFDEASVRRAIAAYFGLVSFLDDNVGCLLRTLEETGLGASTRVIYTSDHGDNLGARGLWGKSTLYEPSAGVPLIMSGPDIPAGYVCREPVTLVDGYPTILDCVGLARTKIEDKLPGTSWFDTLSGLKPKTAAFCEYHTTGATAAAYMLRKGRFKYMHYVGMPPQLFDLDVDPGEVHDFGTDPGYAGLVAECERELRNIVDPIAIDRVARADQSLKIAHFGGREAILAKGAYSYSPVPGTEAVYSV